MNIKSYLTFPCQLTRREVLRLMTTGASTNLVIRQISDTEVVFTPRRGKTEHCRAYLRELEALRKQYDLQIKGFESLSEFTVCFKRDLASCQRKKARALQQKFEAEFLAAL